MARLVTAITVAALCGQLAQAASTVAPAIVESSISNGTASSREGTPTEARVTGNGTTRKTDHKVCWPSSSDCTRVYSGNIRNKAEDYMCLDSAYGGSKVRTLAWQCDERNDNQQWAQTQYRLDDGGELNSQLVWTGRINANEGRLKPFCLTRKEGTLELVTTWCATTLDDPLFPYQQFHIEFPGVSTGIVQLVYSVDPDYCVSLKPNTAGSGFVQFMGSLVGAAKRDVVLKKIDNRDEDQQWLGVHASVGDEAKALIMNVGGPAGAIY